jgi:hypothetical protein
MWSSADERERAAALSRVHAPVGRSWLFAAQKK